LISQKEGSYAFGRFVDNKIPNRISILGNDNRGIELGCMKAIGIIGVERSQIPMRPLVEFN